MAASNGKEARRLWAVPDAPERPACPTCSAGVLPVARETAEAALGLVDPHEMDIVPCPRGRDRWHLVPKQGTEPQL